MLSLPSLELELKELSIPFVNFLVSLLVSQWYHFHCTSTSQSFYTLLRSQAWTADGLSFQAPNGKDRSSGKHLWRKVGWSSRNLWLSRSTSFLRRVCMSFKGLFMLFRVQFYIKMEEITRDFHSLWSRDPRHVTVHDIEKGSILWLSSSLPSQKPFKYLSERRYICMRTLLSHDFTL